MYTTNQHNTMRLAAPISDQQMSGKAVTLIPAATIAGYLDLSDLVHEVIVGTWDIGHSISEEVINVD